MLALALQAVAAFNLVCTGTMIMGSAAHEYEPLEGRFTTTIRVDLTSRRWCDGECRETAPLVRVTPTEIVFAELRPGGGSPSGGTHSVNRESGAYLYASRAGPVFLSHTGTCRRAPFTGFPARRF